jgi:hypothetical protein
MSRNRRPGNLERLRQFRDGAVRTRHAKKDFSSRGIGERAETSSMSDALRLAILLILVRRLASVVN